MGFAKRNTVILAIGFAALVFALFVTSVINSTRNEGIEKETALTAQYESNRNELATYVLTVKEQLGVADRKAVALDKILEDAIKGRYDKSLTAATPGQPQQGNALISAIVEAYPDLSGLDTYDKVIDSISAGRTAYKDKQDKLLDMIRNYDSWRRKGIIKHNIINFLGFPSDSLMAKTGDKVLTGRAALAQMRAIVLTDAAVDAYEKGKMAPIIEPSQNGPFDTTKK